MSEWVILTCWKFVQVQNSYFIFYSGIFELEIKASLILSILYFWLWGWSDWTGITPLYHSMGPTKAMQSRSLRRKNALSRILCGCIAPLERPASTSVLQRKTLNVKVLSMPWLPPAVWEHTSLSVLLWTKSKPRMNQSQNGTGWQITCDFAK